MDHPLQPTDLISATAGCDAHAAHVGWISARIAESLGLNDLEILQFGAAGKCHDIGKRFVSDQVLLKDGPLSLDDWIAVRQHPRAGAALLAGRASELGIDLSVSIDAAWFHHERWDGSGYPHGTRGEKIPLVARVVAVADVFDALTTQRPYKIDWSREQAMSFISLKKGILFDPACVDGFMRVETQMEIAWRQHAKSSLYGRVSPADGLLAPPTII